MSERGVYVVRIYRRDSSKIAGIVESVESGEHLPFRSPERLWHALHSLPSPKFRRQSNQSEKEEKK